jgi:uncharacterized protein (UPF0297 family)
VTSFKHQHCSTLTVSKMTEIYSDFDTRSNMTLNTRVGYILKGEGVKVAERHEEVQDGG